MENWYNLNLKGNLTRRLIYNRRLKSLFVMSVIKGTDVKYLLITSHKNRHEKLKTFYVGRIDVGGFILSTSAKNQHEMSFLY